MYLKYKKTWKKEHAKFLSEIMKKERLAQENKTWYNAIEINLMYEWTDWSLE
jgi:hypothetical protein